MALALHEAGVVKALPARTEQVWRIIKESMPGGMTAAQIMRRMHGVPLGTVTSVLAKMEQRAMIYSRGTKGNGPTGICKQYLTDMERYQLLPPPKDSPANKGGAKRRKDKSQDAGNVQQSSPRSPVANQQAATPPAADPAQVIDQLIEHLTIAQARALHRKLERMFSAKN
jgi:hypothetical protein